VFAFAPAGQQPSPSAAAVIGDVTHIAVHSDPLSTSEVQASPSSHAAGHAPVPEVIVVSHSSPTLSSSVPLPHVN